MTASTDAAATNYVRESAAARTRAAQFIGRNSFTLAPAYSMHITSDGTLSIQGARGSLGHLVSRWEAEFAPDSVHDEGTFLEWATVVEGVSVRLIEEATR